MTKLINERFENKTPRSNSKKVTKNSKHASRNANTREVCQTLKTNQTMQKTLSSEILKTITKIQIRSQQHERK